MGIGIRKRTVHVETGEKSVSDSRILQRHSVRATRKHQYNTEFFSVPRRERRQGNASDALAGDMTCKRFPCSSRQYVSMTFLLRS
jgi:hypothetical protein